METNSSVPILSGIDRHNENESSANSLESPTFSVQHPILEDVTSKYTSDEWTTICQRREENIEIVSSSVIDVENLLRTSFMKKYS